MISSTPVGPVHNYHHLHQVTKKERIFGLVIVLIILNFVFIGALSIQINDLYTKISLQNSQSVPYEVRPTQIVTIPTPSLNTPKPSAPITVTVSPPPTVSLTILKVENNKINAPFPKGSRVYSTLGQTTTIIVNGSTFAINAEGGKGGPCPLIPDASGCTYTDESFPQIPIFRIWSDDNGIFMLNPQSIAVDDFYLPSATIEKKKPNPVFTPEEINIWKNAIRSISIAR